MIKGMTRVIGALCAASACQGVLSTCGRDAPPAAKVVPRSKGSLDVVVTVPPLKGLVQPLLPEGSSVTVLMKPGRSEHGYELSPDDIVRVKQTDESAGLNWNRVVRAVFEAYLDRGYTSSTLVVRKDGDQRRCFYLFHKER